MHTCLLVLKGGMEWKANNNTEFSKSRHRKLNHSTNTDFRPWADLPGELVELISKRLGFVDYLAFGCVCRPWRLVAVADREKFTASKPPLLVLISLYAKRACSLYNISDGKRYKTMLPNLAGRSCWGFSCGYLIMRDKSYKMWLVNLITREELHFPVLPECFRRFYTLTPDFRILLAYSTVLSEFVMLFAHTCHKNLYFARAGDADWTVYSFAGEQWVITDLAVFYGEIYVVTNRARIGTLKLKPHPILSLLDVKGTPFFLSVSWQLLSSNEQLIMVDSCFPSRIYKLDHTVMEWEKMQSLGEEALFLNDTQSSMVSNPSMWGGHSNCIYYIGFNRCYTYFLDGREGQSLPFVEENQVGLHQPFFWYFPHQSHNKNLLEDGI